MPEIAEIHRFCLRINQKCAGVVFRAIKTAADPNGPSQISASVRGKELTLVLIPIAAGIPLVTCWNFGLVGRFIVTENGAAPPHAVVTFQGDNGLCLSYCDSQKMGKWRHGSFDLKRSPDPVLDHTAFVSKLLQRLPTTPHWKKPIGEILLAQDLFNGVGNYLRAEICYRAGVSPFTPCNELFEELRLNPGSYSFDGVTTSSPKGHLVLFLCRAIPLEVLEKGLNKYGDDEEQAAFTAWLRIYQKGEEGVVAGRKMHYSKKPLAVPDLPLLTCAPPASYSGSRYPSSPEGTSTSTSAGTIIVAGAAPIPAAVPSPAAPSHPPSSPAPPLQPASLPTLPVFGRASFAIEQKSADPSALLNFPPALYDIREQLLGDSLSNMAKLLLLVARVYKTSHITSKEKDVLKVMAMSQDQAIFAALSAFFADWDLVEFVDSAKKRAQFFAAQLSNARDNASTAHHEPAPSLFVGFASPSPPSNPLPPSTSSSSSSSPIGLTDPEWVAALASEFAQPYFARIQRFVAGERSKHKVYPPEDEVFAALNSTPLSKVKAVILGQDPYFNENQAHGLCFSVRKGIKTPPSLSRMYTVLEKTIPGFKRPGHGCLQDWADQGVLLLNATLTVEDGKPNSHSAFGWQRFTDYVIKVLLENRSNLVFILWGGFAQKKGAAISPEKHCVLSGPHPSPMSGNVFLECTHFADCNRYLSQHGITPIDWRLKE